MVSLKESKRSEIRFTLNGKNVVVRDANPRASLGDFLRDQMHLRGLKLPCRQGGCGACTVLFSAPQRPENEFPQHRPVNSCLRPLCSVDGMSITTIEGIGNCKEGLHPLQDAIVKYHGTQCGYCTPGMVMNMYGLLKQSPSPQQQQIEEQLDGNICRCTGYRPILDAFQSFACEHSEGPCKGKNSSSDIEDLFTAPEIDEIQITKDGVTWIKVRSLSSLYEVLKKNQTSGVQIICGNTSTGVYPHPLERVVVDISSLNDLRKVFVDSQAIRIGGAASLTDFMIVLKSKSTVSAGYATLLKHLKRVATHQVRNIGSVAGNLMMAYKHPDFLSDVATLLTTATATMRVYNIRSSKESIISVEQFFSIDNAEDLLILEISIPLLGVNTRLHTYKVALRRVNSHAIANAGFKFEIDTEGIITNSPIIVYGGIQAYPLRARKTENFLKGKSYMNLEVIQQALNTLQSEVVPCLGHTAYRASLVPAFFYKSILSLWPAGKIPARLLSSISEYPWPITSGTVHYDKGDPSEYPVSKPLPKMSAATQATGEAQYLDDVKFGDELHATFVLSTVANAKIKLIDPSKALSEKGVVTFLSASSIALAGYCNNVNEYEEVFASSSVSYCGQAVGLIVATSKDIADRAAKLVDVQYTDIKQPILTIEDAIKSNSFFKDRYLDHQHGSTQKAFEESEVVIVEGEVSVGHQNHFHLETQRSVCVPQEDGFLEVHSSTQNPTLIQKCVGIALGRSQHKITVHVRRVGGAYGAKINRSASIAMACAFAADKLRRPVRLSLDLSTNMQLVGARSPFLCKYKVSATKEGQITAIQMNIFNNQGAHYDFGYPDGESILTFIDNVYRIPHWDLKMRIARTNLPACTYMRGPVFVEAVFMMESAIEHVSSALKMDPSQVRTINMYDSGDVTLMGQRLSYCNAKTVFNTVKTSSNYIERVKNVKSYNSNSLWVKRGISLIPVKFVAAWESQQQRCLINIYPDATITIHHSGCELGQGLDVKVAQVAAMSLGSLVEGGVPLENIAVHTTTTVVANNVTETGGSVTSELCAKAVQDGCSELVERLTTVKKMLMLNQVKPDWKKLIEAALDAGVDLQARGRVHPKPSNDGPYQYVSFGAAVTEVEVDVLTGETSILRSDVLLDCGKSLNPAIDIGQVQGAFVQGLGYFLSEEYRYDSVSGKLLTDGTWEYKPPSCRDIPWDFRVALLPNSENPSGFLRSKFSGEPPYGLACSAIIAVSEAVEAAKSEMGRNKEWKAVSAPATVENVALAFGSPLSFVSIREMFTSL